MNRTGSQRRIPALLAVACVVAAAGCAMPMRGRDFGHWIGVTEPVPLIRICGPDDGAKATPIERLLVLPLLADLDPEQLASLRRTWTELVRVQFPCRIQAVDAEGLLATYVDESNIQGADGQFNLAEVARLGRYLEASHVLAAHVPEARPYHPQNLEIAVIVVEAGAARPVAELNAGFPAGDQRVLAVLARHLDRRAARPYDRTSLDLVLRSPAEYGRFALAECCRVLAEHLRADGRLSRSGHAPISRTTRYPGRYAKED